METLSHPKQTKAIKRHTCDFCGGVIIVGENYIKSTHTDEGGVYDWKAHRHCSRLASRLDMYDRGSEYSVSSAEFIEIVSDAYSNIIGERIPMELRGELSDIIEHLKYVSFHKKLWFVIKHYKEIDKEVEF